MTSAPLKRVQIVRGEDGRIKEALVFDYDKEKETLLDERNSLRDTVAKFEQYAKLAEAYTARVLEAD